MMNLIIKGNMFDASNAAHARGIARVSAAQLFDNRPSEVVASVADAALTPCDNGILRQMALRLILPGLVVLFDARGSRAHGRRYVRQRGARDGGARRTSLQFARVNKR